MARKVSGPSRNASLDTRTNPVTGGRAKFDFNTLRVDSVNVFESAEKTLRI